MTLYTRLRHEIHAGSKAGAQRSGELLYRCWVNCDDLGVPFMCSLRGCSTPVLWDCWYCDLHLYKHCGLQIKPSLTGHGNGLFAMRNFRKGARVGHYGGELLTADEMYNRYNWMRKDSGRHLVITAPYALGTEGSDNVNDAARVRGATSYCNSTRGTGIQPNAVLGDKYVQALRSITAGEEILVNYGDEYWTCAGPECATHRTIISIDPLNEVPYKRRKA